MTPNSKTEPRTLRAEIGAVRRDGFAIDDGEVRCFAVPVRDFTGAVMGAIGISGPVRRLSIAHLKSRGCGVKDAAERLSAAFGASAQKRGWGKVAFAAERTWPRWQNRLSGSKLTHFELQPAGLLRCPMKLLPVCPP